MQILHLVPLTRRLLQNMYTIGTLTRLTVVNNVGNQIVLCVLMILAIFFGKNVTEIDVPEMILEFCSGSSNDKRLSSVEAYRIGKLTIVGFFSKKNVFFVKRFM